MTRNGYKQLLWFFAAYHFQLAWRVWEFGGRVAFAMWSVSLHLTLGPARLGLGLGLGPRRKKVDPSFVEDMDKLEKMARKRVMLSKGFDSKQFAKWRERNPETWKHAVLTEAKKQGVK